MKKKHSYSFPFVLMVMISVLMLSCNSGSKSSNQGSSSEAASGSPEMVSPAFQISLAQWSLHRTFFGGAIQDWEAFNQMLAESPDDVLKGTVDPMDFPTIAKGYGINCIELVNTFYFSKANDQDYWAAFKQKCDEAGVTVGLIMCDALGNLGDADPAGRRPAAEIRLEVAVHLAVGQGRAAAG